MGADLKSNAGGGWDTAPEVAPSTDPIATNPEHSGPEVAPSNDPIVRRQDYSGIEVVADQPSRHRNGVDDSYAEKFLRKDSKERRICGLRKVTFWLSLALAVVIIAGAVGGGVGGALANKAGNKTPVGQTENMSSTTSPATSSSIDSTSSTSSESRTTSATASVVTSGTTGIAAISCNGTTVTTSNGVSYREFCRTDWPVGFADLHGSGTVQDIQDVTVYTFQSCMDACDDYNVKYQGACKALTYNANLTSAVPFSGGNCILKSSQASTNVSAGSLVASAAILS